MNKYAIAWEENGKMIVQGECDDCTEDDLSTAETFPTIELAQHEIGILKKWFPDCDTFIIRLLPDSGWERV
jgi:hypothetical protein